jgi:hypothetical protein
LGPNLIIWYLQQAVYEKHTWITASTGDARDPEIKSSEELKKIRKKLALLRTGGSNGAFVLPIRPFLVT